MYSYRFACLSHRRSTIPPRESSRDHFRSLIEKCWVSHVWVTRRWPIGVFLGSSKGARVDYLLGYDDQELFWTLHMRVN
jgi:hypothetical protein